MSEPQDYYWAGTRDAIDTEYPNPISQELLFFATYIGPLVIDQAVEKVRELEHLSDMADDLILDYSEKLDERRWVPVSERLPEDSQKHLAVILKGRPTMPQTIRYNPGLHRGWIAANCTYWTELPPIPGEN